MLRLIRIAFLVAAMIAAAADPADLHRETGRSAMKDHLAVRIGP